MAADLVVRVKPALAAAGESLSRSRDLLYIGKKLIDVAYFPDRDDKAAAPLRRALVSFLYLVTMFQQEAVIDHFALEKRLQASGNDGLTDNLASER